MRDKPKKKTNGEGSQPNVSVEHEMAETITSYEHDEYPRAVHDETPFLCEFCEDIKIASEDAFDMQSELDVCRRCVRIDRSVRFADFLLIQ
ncbi:MAG: hypothetical protein ACE5FN_06810 [Leptospirillia bacterium]